MYHTFYMSWVLALWPLSLSRSPLCIALLTYTEPKAASSLSYWTSREGKKGSEHAPLLFLHPASLVHTFYWTKIIKQPAYNLINLFYVCEYCNPVGCLLIPLHPHYKALFLLNDTSANCICEVGAKAGNQVCCRTRPKYYTETPHFTGRTFIPPRRVMQSGNALPG